ncbi:MAG: glycerol-3-phosphate acyltransferase [Chloroflexota bacterium]
MNPSLLLTTLYALFSFLCGALPFSVWLSRWAGRDAREIGDRNPGATNAFKAGGWRVGISAFALDIAKGAFPVGLAWFVFGWRGWEIAPIALAPMLGHAFSPFLNFRGGKALAVSLGVWIGLTLWQMPLFILPPLILVFLLTKRPAWAVLAALASLSVGLWLAGEPVFWGVYVPMAAFLLWRQSA